MIKLVKSSFYNEAEAKEALAQFVLSTDSFSMGKECEKFERAFAEKQGRRYAVLVNSGSSANLVLIQALMNLDILKKGDQVGFSALTWATNVMPLIQLGLTPVPLDCELETLNVSPQIVRENLENLDALFITHVLGFSHGINEIKELCEENGVVLLEDNCEALGSVSQGIRLGNFGLASTFSFFVGHHLSTIEGGMIATDDEALYEMLLMTRAHGWGRNLAPDSKQRIEKKFGIDPFFAQYTFYDLAFNLRPTEITGFLGNRQIPFWDEIVTKRQENFLRFSEKTLQNPRIMPLEIRDLETVSNFAMPLVFKEKEGFLRARESFKSADVEIRPIIAGDITDQPFYRKYVEEKRDCPNSRLVHENGLYFGNNPELTGDELRLLEELVLDAGSA